MPTFGTELRRVAAQRRVVPRLVAERPEEWRLGPLTVALGSRGAQLRYARIAVARAPAEPGAVMTAWQRALAALAAGSVAPDALWPLLEASYAALRDAPAARVDLVKLRTDLARRVRGHTRAQFAWDLARLRRERRLAQAGRRIDLGVATGVLRASRVVWIEDESGGGQYYAHFRILEE